MRIQENCSCITKHSGQVDVRSQATFTRRETKDFLHSESLRERELARVSKEICLFRLGMLQRVSWNVQRKYPWPKAETAIWMTQSHKPVCVPCSDKRIKRDRQPYHHCDSRPHGEHAHRAPKCDEAHPCLPHLCSLSSHPYPSPIQSVQRLLYRASIHR